MAGAKFRGITPGGRSRTSPERASSAGHFGLEVDGSIVASGGVLTHYNPPYGDLFMEVAEPHRGRGLGSLMVRELRRVCREMGRVPAARCDAGNTASWATLKRGGMVPCGFVLVGDLPALELRMADCDRNLGPSSGRGAVPPVEIQAPRFLMRCWKKADASRFKAALDFSLAELQPWIPWTRHEPSPAAVLEERLAGYHVDFLEGRDALYGLFDKVGAVIGGAGLYRRVGPGAIEIGYWIRSNLAGRGYATEATALLTSVGHALPGIERIEIRCHPDNAASGRIPAALGYRLPTQSSDTSEPLSVWTMDVRR